MRFEMKKLAFLVLLLAIVSLSCARQKQPLSSETKPFKTWDPSAPPPPPPVQLRDDVQSSGQGLLSNATGGKFSDKENEQEISFGVWIFARIVSEEQQARHPFPQTSIRTAGQRRRSLPVHIRCMLRIAFPRNSVRIAKSSGLHLVYRCFHRGGSSASGATRPPAGAGDDGMGLETCERASTSSRLGSRKAGASRRPHDHVMRVMFEARPTPRRHG